VPEPAEVKPTVQVHGKWLFWMRIASFHTVVLFPPTSQLRIDRVMLVEMDSDAIVRIKPPDCLLVPCPVHSTFFST